VERDHSSETKLAGARTRVGWLEYKVAAGIGNVDDHGSDDRFSEMAWISAMFRSLEEYKLQISMAPTVLRHQRE
jgi:hypothetical protein